MTPSSQVHVHGRGYFALGGGLRCGCDADALIPLVASPAAERPVRRWLPVRHQFVGFVRTHFIYSDRMPLPSR